MPEPVARLTGRLRRHYASINDHILVRDIVCFFAGEEIHQLHYTLRKSCLTQGNQFTSSALALYLGLRRYTCPEDFSGNISITSATWLAGTEKQIWGRGQENLGKFDLVLNCRIWYVKRSSCMERDILAPPLGS